MTIAFEEYPKMLYAPDGKQRVVHDEDEEAVAREELGISDDDAPKLKLKRSPKVSKDNAE